MEAVLDGFRHALDPAHLSTKLHNLVFHQATTPGRDLSDDLADIRAFLQHCDEICYRPDDQRPVAARLALARSLTSAGESSLQLLTSIAAEIIERTQWHGFPPHLMAKYQA